MAAVMAAAGVLCGISEAPGLIRLMAFISALLFTAFYIDKDMRDLRKRPVRYIRSISLGLVFFIFLIRGAVVCQGLNDSGSLEFFSGFEPTVPGQFDYGTYLKSMGVGTEAEYEAFMDEKENGSDSFAGRVRDKLSREIDEAVPAGDAGLYRAILLGDKEGLDEETEELYQKAGIAHILAVSGLHTGIIGMGFYKMSVRLGLGKRPAGIISSMLLLFYMNMCGMQSSVMRAAVMLILSFAAAVGFRSYDMRTALSFSFLIILFWRPYQIFFSGFQLSFAAVAAITFAGNELIRGIERLKAKGKNSGRHKYISGRYRLKGYVKTVLISLSIQLVMLPILAWNFFTFPVYGILINFIVIPLMGLIVMSGMAMLFFALLLDIAGLPGTIASLASAPGHYLLLFYKLLCEWSLRLPGAVMVTGRPSIKQIILYYLLLILMILMIKKAHKKTAAVTAAIIMLINAALLKAYDTERFYVAAIDVGQGDGFVIKAYDRYLTVDMGSSSNLSLGERVIEPYLLSKRITAIDLAVVSHADQDHISGISYLLNESEYIDVSLLALPEAAADNERYNGLKQSMAKAGGSIAYLTGLERIFEYRDVKLTCIYGGSVDANDANRHSSILLLEKGDGFSMLFTGDAGVEDEAVIAGLYKEYEELSNEKLSGEKISGEKPSEGKITGNEKETGITVLKAGHHGSATSTSELLLDTVNPSVVLLSYGKNNRYGHPAAETLSRIEKRGIPAISTCKNGTLIITEDGIRPAMTK